VTHPGSHRSEISPAMSPPARAGFNHGSHLAVAPKERIQRRKRYEQLADAD